MMTSPSYFDRYQTINMRRSEGILEVRFHTDGGPLRWGLLPHREFEEAFLEVARDKSNEIVILTGTGDEFCGPQVKPGEHFLKDGIPPEKWDVIYWEAKHILGNLLNIDVPVIAAVNGPTTRHAELPLLSDIVVASDTACFQDSAHFQGGMVPGDGVHAIFPLLMGHNRGRYFLLMGESIDARRAYEIGLVNEVLPKELVLSRAWEIARLLLKQPPLVRRYSRILLVRKLKKELADMLEFGIALEGLAASAR